MEWVALKVEVIPNLLAVSITFRGVSNSTILAETVFLDPSKALLKVSGPL